MSELPRIRIIHGFASNPQDCWFPWLRAQLAAVGFDVALPVLPHPERPQPDAWVAAVRAAAGSQPERTMLIGHSLGCQAILRFAATLSVEHPLLGAVFVGGWLTPPKDDHPERTRRRRPWFVRLPDLALVRTRIRRCIALLSDDDPFAPLAGNGPLYAQRLGATVLSVHGKKHFRARDGVLELPEAFEAVRIVLNDATPQP